MKARNIKILSIFLVLLCCFMGAVSAADDVSMDAVDASVDDAVIADTVIDDTEDSTAVEETPVDVVSDDTTTEETNEEIQTDEISEESADVDSEQNRAVGVNVDNWNDLKKSCKNSTDMIITLNGTEYKANSQITFSNSATIIGTSNSYITDGTYHAIPFLNTNSALTITFKNVKFRNMNVNNLLQLAGTNVLENCSFYNITAGTGHNAVVYNSQGTMNITGCNITDSSAGYGVVSNYIFSSVTGVVMNVNNCKFINNYAGTEPGAINNCGILYVNNSEFTNNSAAMWAGAIHTHTNAQTYIFNSNFTGNIAGWNGGALYTYSLLEVYNSTFKENKCHTSAGGGAIGCSNYGSTYNVTICNCTFIDNENLCGNTNETPSTGTGGAIAAMNDGILKVCGSTFVQNVAGFGQAIAAYSQGYISPEGNISAGIPKVIVCNNNFTNHTLTSSDTVELSGNYTFENNTFNNCHQSNLGTNNVFNNPVYANNNLIPKNINTNLLKNILTSSPLGDDPIIIFVNASKDSSGDGSSWDEAFGGEWAIDDACCEISDIGIIYAADGIYGIDPTLDINYPLSITFIGQGKNTIFNNITTPIYQAGDPERELTFINLTIAGAYNDFGRNSRFINCTFLSDINMEKAIQDYLDQGMITQVQLDESEYARTYFFEFDNCEFKNLNSENSPITLYRYSQVKFTNCTFDNIVADSIIGKNGEFIYQDGIYLYDCNFTNCNIKGVADIPGDIEILDYCAIENCDYDFDATTNVVSDDEHAHNYLNATKLAKPDTTLVADVDDAGNLLVSLTAGGNAVANGKVLISVNGAEAVSYDLGEDGTLSIALSDLTDATGKLNIAVNFEETDDYKGSSGSASAVLVVKTVTEKIDPVDTAITASDITATAKIAKTLSITLKDANGNALANKAVKVTVNGKTSTVTTDKNGVAKVTVNYAKAGTYYYSLSFLGDNDYKASLKPVKVTVNKQATKATFAKKTFKVKATKKISFTLKDSKGKAIAKKKITFKVNGKTYTAKTNSKGVATVKIVIKKKGKYTATAKFAGDTTYKAISKKATITIK